MKNIIRKLHLIIGLLSGLIVFVVSITGCIYSFEEEFRGALYKQQLSVTPQKNRISISALIDTVKNKHHLEIKNIRIKNDPTSSIEFQLKDKTFFYINPYTAEYLGTINKEKDLFGICLQIHRSLYLGDAGKWITGISALLFLTMLISGIILWWPRKNAPKRLAYWFKSQASKKRKTFDLHRVLGFYASFILIFVVLTGLIWSFKWAENTMYWLSGSKKEERQKVQSKENLVNTFSLDSVLSDLKKNTKKAADCFISFPEDKKGNYRISFRSDDGRFFKHSDQFFIDQYSGKVLKAKTFDKAQTGDKLKAANYDIHTGKALGIMGQIIVFIAGLISASLPITGFLIWKNKR